MTPEAIASFTANMVKNLKAVSVPDSNSEQPQFVCDPQKAIREKSITCAICGKTMRVMTQRHLNTHNITAEEYREMCGYKKDQALICKELRKARKKTLERTKIWERRDKTAATAASSEAQG